MVQIVKEYQRTNIKVLILSLYVAADLCASLSNKLKWLAYAACYWAWGIQFYLVCTCKPQWHVHKAASFFWDFCLDADRTWNE